MLCLGNFSLKTTWPIGKDRVDDVKAGRCIAGIQVGEEALIGFDVACWLVLKMFFYSESANCVLSTALRAGFLRYHIWKFLALL